MAAYLFRRLWHSLVMLLVILSFVFFAGRMIGDPAVMILGAEAGTEQLERLRDALGLNDPVLVQYGRFLVDVARGDFGETFRFGRATGGLMGAVPDGQPAMPIVLRALPATFLLAGTAIVIAVALALPLGIAAAMRPRSIVDRAVNVVSLAGISVVEFWLALMLVWLFAVTLGWLPTSGYGHWSHVVLPALALTGRAVGRITQLVRSAMLDELGKPYVLAARGKGLSRTRIALVHALKNASIPIVTIIGDEAANILTGVIIIESIFGWPGIGMVTIEALQRADLPVVQAAVLVIAVLVITVNLLVDVAYTLLNPRIRLA